MTRRQALGAMGMASLAAALEVSVPQLERAVAAVESIAESPEPRAESAQPYVPKFFTTREWRVLRVLVDDIIPRDTRSGSATDAKVPEFMDFLLADKDASIASQTSMRGGLAWLDGESRERFGVGYAAATRVQRHQILDDIAYPRSAKPEFSQGVAFFTRIRDMTASGFFSSAMGWKDVQYVGNTFNPSWDGCPPPALQKLGVSQDLMNTRVKTDI